MKSSLARFQGSENEIESNDRVDDTNEESKALQPDAEADDETQAMENNPSQTQNGNSSQESTENVQDDSPSTEDQTQAEAETNEVNSDNAVDNSCTTAVSEPDSEDHSTDRTGTMSPKSFATFKGFLVHPPQMNLPWEPMRSIRQCTCGIAFSYSVRKVPYI